MFLGVFYIIWIGVIWWGFYKIPDFEVQTISPKTGFSIIIPFKNETENLSGLIDSLQKLHYPDRLFEIITVDDHSNDNSSKIVENQPNIKLINNIGKGKKQALQTGIMQARFKWIITIDADCQVSSKYLQSLNAFILQRQPEMLLGPVRYFDTKSFLGQFQQFEFLCLQALTIAGVGYHKAFLANGANLIFRKQSFEAVKGYEGNIDIASGDDTFLLQKFTRNFPDKIRFIKSGSAIVKTKAAKSFIELIHQKIRWAGKSRTKGSAVAKFTGIITVLFHLVLIYAFLTLSANYGFVIIKIMADAFCLYQINRFYRVKLDWWFYVLGFVIYPFYLILIFILALKGTYHWKGQTYRQ